MEYAFFDQRSNLTDGIFWLPGFVVTVRGGGGGSGKEKEKVDFQTEHFA